MAEEFDFDEFMMDTEEGMESAVKALSSIFQEEFFKK